MQDGRYAATFTTDRGKDFGFLDVKNGKFSFSSWVKSSKNSEKPKQGLVISQSCIWAGKGQLDKSFEVVGEWDDKHASRYEAIRRNMERQLSLETGSHQEKLFL